MKIEIGKESETEVENDDKYKRRQSFSLPPNQKNANFKSQMQKAYFTKFIVQWYTMHNAKKAHMRTNNEKIVNRRYDSTG